MNHASSAEVCDVSNRVFELQQINWFSRLGGDGSDLESRLVDECLEKLDLPPHPVRYAQTVEDVQDCLDHSFDANWLDAEERAYKNISGQAHVDRLLLDNHAQTKFLLTVVADKSASCAQQAIGVSNPYLAKAAAGSAMENCYRFFLETLIDDESRYYFASKLELFRLGRWPLCISNGFFVLY